MNKHIIPRYCDANSILLVNRLGNMRKLYCPFWVKYIGNTNNFKTGVFLWVEEVATNENGELIYLILGKPYQHTHFEILASF